MSSRKRILWWVVGAVGGALLAVLVAFCFLTLFAKLDYEQLNLPRRWVAASIAEKWAAAMETIPQDEQNTVDVRRLESELNCCEKAFMRKVLGIDPRELGFEGPYHGEKAPQDLVEVDGDATQLFPRDALEDFERMNEQMRSDIGRKLTIKSGYRSPGKQAYLFFYDLTDTETGAGFSLSESAKRIALPGYSEHGSGRTPAFDFSLENESELLVGENGAAMSSEEKAVFIEDTEEYEWMQQNAHRFDYYLSYPRDNDLGVDFEPWHWHWERPGNDS
jgi:hypothetical protein